MYTICIILYQEDENTVTMKERAYQELKKAILSGEYNSGDFLQEVNLAEKIGMSRTPVREALLLLEREGLVDIVANKGARVSQLSMNDAIYISQVRIALEVLAIKLSIESLSEDTLLKFRDTFEYGLQKGLSMNESEKELMRKTGDELHQLIIDSSKNPYLISYYKDLQLRLSRVINESRRVGRQLAAIKEHQKVVNALLKKNIEEAQRAMEEHIRSSMNDTIERLQEQIRI